jgi:hypothetical protein
VVEREADPLGQAWLVDADPAPAAHLDHALEPDAHARVARGPADALVDVAHEAAHASSECSIASGTSWTPGRPW